MMTKIVLIFSLMVITINSYSQGTWDAATIKAYMDNCIPEAQNALSKQEAGEYCYCTMKKLESRYPNAADLNKLKEDEINQLAKVCLAEITDTKTDSKTNTNGNPPTPPRPPGSTVKAENKTGATTWSKITYDAFMKSCVDSAKESLGEKESNTYCSCAAGKLQILYPDETQLESIPQEVISKVAGECLE